MTPAQLMTPVYRLARLWTILGVMLLLAVVALSLLAIPPPLGVPGGDKASHLIAYAVLMGWWGMLQQQRKWMWAVALPLMGLILEFLQTLTRTRVLEWNDALANLLGVLLALALLATPAAGLLAWLDRLLADRSDTRRS